MGSDGEEGMEREAHLGTVDGRVARWTAPLSSEPLVQAAGTKDMMATRDDWILAQLATNFADELSDAMIWRED